LKTIAYNEILYRAAEAAGRTRDNLPLEEAAVLKSVFALDLPKIWAGEDWDDIRQPLAAVSLDSAKSFSNPYQDTARVIVNGAGYDVVNAIYTLDVTSGNYFEPGGNVISLIGSAWTISDSQGHPLYTSDSLINVAWTPATAEAPVPASAYFTICFGDVLGIYDQLPTGNTPWKKVEFYRSGDLFTVMPGLNQPWWGTAPVPMTIYVYYQAPCPDLLGMTTDQLNTLKLPLIFGNWLALRGAAQLLSADGASALAGVNFGVAESALGFERTRIQRPVWTKVP
jgi:hypothetical protein